MIVKTDYMGDVEVQEDMIYTFEEGIYGFPDSKRFVFLGEMTQDFPFLWMQCIDIQQTVFIVTSPFLFKDDYDFELNEATTTQLALKGIEEAAVYSMVVIPEEVKDITINLKSPVVLNLREKKGRQVILSEEYPYKFPIFRKGDAGC